MDLYNLPFFRSYEAQLGWIIQTVKKWDLKFKEFFEGGGIRRFVDEVLSSHPEWTTTIMDGAITKAKLAKSLINYIDEWKSADAGKTLGLARVMATSDISATGTIQGAAYNTDTGTMLLAMGDNNIIELNADLQVVGSAAGAYGHPNDIAYYDGNYYIAADNTLAGEIIIVNASTLATSSSKIIPEVIAKVVNISYDEVNDVFWIIDDNLNLYTANTTLTTATQIGTLTTADLLDNQYEGVNDVFLGGSACIAGSLMLLGCIGRYSTGPSIARVIRIDIDGSVTSWTDSEMLTVYDEAEALLYNGKQIMMISYTGNFTNFYVSGISDLNYQKADYIEWTTGSTALDDAADIPERTVSYAEVHFENGHPRFTYDDGMLSTMVFRDSKAQTFINKHGQYNRFYRSGSWTNWNGPLGVVVERTTVYPGNITAGSYIEYEYTLQNAQPDTDYTVVCTPIYGRNVMPTIQNMNTTKVTLEITNNNTADIDCGYQIAILRTAD